MRPSRYYVTDDDYIVMSSEVGVLDFAPDTIIKKDRLHPGQLLLVDLKEGRIIPDDEVKKAIVAEHPYGEWVKEHLIQLEDVLELLKYTIQNCHESSSVNLFLDTHMKN